MKLQQKFFVLAGLVGLLLAAVSVIGFYTADSNLETSVDQELSATVQTQGASLDGWLAQKATSASHTANLMAAFNGDSTRSQAQNSLAVASDDADILDVTVGMEDGFIQSFYAGNNTGKRDPRQRPWYKDAKSAGQTFFTEAYVDSETNKLVVSAVTPFSVNGAFGGAICSDITLDVLKSRVQSIKYRGEGSGIIIEKTGNVLATAGSEEPMSDIHKEPGIGEHFDEMLQKGEGFFLMDDYGGEKSVFAYTSIASTGWIVGIAVPYDFVFASVNMLKLTYGLLTVIGLALVVFMCLRFASIITGSVKALEEHAVQLADGNLRMDDIAVTSSDEIGSLTKAFNGMGGSLRNLIKKMASTSEQVAASSEELTANAQQSANTSVHVAETVGDVGINMEQQLNDVQAAMDNVNIVYKDIQRMAEDSDMAAKTSEQTAEAAQRGAQLMEEAVKKMSSIEASVMASAEVVKKLGENSQQIGQIIDAISSIAEATNLLSLNAAIEAARAGEHGRGFAVVAEEVRKLAAESQTSAEKIKERIASIQQDTSRAVESMQSGTHDVQAGTQAIREVGEQFKDIMTMVNGIQKQIGGISRSAADVSTGAKQIVEAITSIDAVSRKTADATQTISSATEEQSASNEEIAAASQALATLAAEMQDAIGSFKF